MSMPVVGYRLWNAVPDTCVLTSISEPVEWPSDGVLEADRSPDSASEWSQPGIHWYARFDQPPGRYVYDLTPSHSLWFDIARISRRLTDTHIQHWVSGAVLVGGRTVIHERGGRSSYGRILALHYEVGPRDRSRGFAYDEYDGESPPPELRAIAARYEVPLCESPDALRAVALEHGEELSEEGLVA